MLTRLCSFAFAFVTIALVASNSALSADLLVPTFDDTGGLTVLRYNASTFSPAPGTVATGNNGLGVAQGLAVAADGSFYVSSNSTTVGVLHYSSGGTYLGKLGQSDITPAPIDAPGALAFGPNGNLYVSNLGTTRGIFQFDTTSATQQYVAANTLSLGYTPGGYAFANVSNDLIVSALDFQSVTQYHSDATSTTLLGPGSGLNVSAILPESGGTFLLADFDLGFEPLGHHQVVRFDPAEDPGDQISLVVNLTTPVGTGDTAGDAPQPTSLLFDAEGNLLIGVSPDHNLNGAIFRYDFAAP